MSELSISGSDMLGRLEQKIDALSTKLMELKDDLHGMSQSHEARLTTVEMTLDVLKEDVKSGKESRKRIHERLEKLEHLPGEQALKQQEDAKKAAKMTVIRMTVTIVLSALAVTLVLFTEKAILGF